MFRRLLIRRYSDDAVPPYTGQQLPRGVYFDAYTNKYVRSDRVTIIGFTVFGILLFVILAMITALVVING